MTADDGSAWPPADLPVMDRAALETLRELEDEEAPDLVAETTRLFLGDAEQRLGELEQAVANGELERARILGHTLKGASLVMGVRRLAWACGGLEAAAASASAATTGLWWERVAREYRLAADALWREISPAGES